MHELVWVRGGTMTVRVGDKVFTVSEGSGLWLPAGAVHSGRLTAGVEFFDALFAPASSPVAFAGPTVIVMTSVLESLLTHLSRAELDAAARSRAEAVVFDVLEPSDDQLALQLPAESGIDAIAEALMQSRRRPIAGGLGPGPPNQRTHDHPRLPQNHRIIVCAVAQGASSASRAHPVVRGL